MPVLYFGNTHRWFRIISFKTIRLWSGLQSTFSEYFRRFLPYRFSTRFGYNFKWLKKETHLSEPTKVTFIIYFLLWDCRIKNQSYYMRHLSGNDGAQLRYSHGRVLHLTITFLYFFFGPWLAVQS